MSLEQNLSYEGMRSIIFDALGLTAHDVGCQLSKILMSPKGWLKAHLETLGFVPVPSRDESLRKAQATARAVADQIEELVALVRDGDPAARGYKMDLKERLRLAEEAAEKLRQECGGQ